MNNVVKPSIPNLEDILVYLDNLRESGVVNMYGAVPYIMDVFDMEKDMAKDALVYWMKTFEERHTA